ncbi:integral membrane protein [Xylariomycetidae sp. FL0641]|nr:integral membrane protein [Xylariomycetidae sp. FL0641]
MAVGSPDDLGPAVLAVAWTFAAISIIVVAARLYVRMGILRRLTADDYIVIFTLLLGLGNSVFLTISTSWGLGKHIDDLSATPLRVVYTIKWVYLCEFFSIMSPGFGRISFAILLLGLTPPSRWRRRLLWAIICTQFVVDVGTVAISFSQCTPINGFWDKNVDAECWPPYVQQYTGFFQGSLCSLVDLVLAVYPMSLFWNLMNMKWKQKLSLSVLMGLGAFSMVASIVKTVQLQAITQTADLTYAMANLAIWWSLEAYLVLIAVSIPTIRPILKGNSLPSHTDSRPPNSKPPGPFNSWPHTTGKRTVDGAGPFEPLGDTVVLGEMNGAYCARAYETDVEMANNGGGHEQSAHDGIRKDITVSVTFGQTGRPDGPGNAL